MEIVRKPIFMQNWTSIWRKEEEEKNVTCKRMDSNQRNVQRERECHKNDYLGIDVLIPRNVYLNNRGTYECSE